MGLDLPSNPTGAPVLVWRVKAGVFVTDHLSYVRNQWLQEGNARGLNQFNSITHSTPEGDCIVKQLPMFYEDVKIVTEELKVPYHSTGIGKATLQAIEHLMKPKR